MTCSVLAVMCFTAWQPHTIALETISDTLIAVDAVQTSRLTRDGFVERESDCIIGRHPSPRSTFEYFGGLEIGHVLLTNALEKVSPRAADIFQGISISWEGSTIAMNMRLGVRW